MGIYLVKAGKHTMFTHTIYLPAILSQIRQLGHLF